MRVLDTEFVKQFIEMADDGWKQGWHERNGGNLSYRLKLEERQMIEEDLKQNEPWKPIGTEVPGIGGETFLVTGSGKFFRNVKINPEESMCVIEVNSEGTSYRMLWGEDVKPTSELPTHLMNHEIKKKVSGNCYRVIYHAHPANVIALTFVLPLKEEVFTRELWEMATECPVVFPLGIGVVPWMVPGGRDIAVETAKLMQEHDAAVWAHHGLFCAGETFDSTFGLMHTIEKAAEILVKVKSMGGEKLQTIKPDGFRKLAESFDITLPEKYLYEK